ncbi:hypothetical protein GCM10018966_018570 [Streptomyces yanii]
MPKGRTRGPVLVTHGRAGRDVHEHPHSSPPHLGEAGAVKSFVPGPHTAVL